MAQDQLNAKHPALRIRRAVVLGAGVMGAQVAAHLAAAGVRTHLLDLKSDKAPDDPALAKLVGKHFANFRSLAAIETLKKLKPAPLYGNSVLANLIPGNFDDDLSVIAEADWVFEAVIEKLDIKKNIHKRIAEYLRPGVPVSSNTSGLGLSEIVKDLSPEYRQAFSGIHFFNPPRYMRLVELIPSAETDIALAKRLAAFVEETLGKSVVVAKDTVNFIANRVGVLTIGSTLHHMQELGLNVETVDELTGKLMGRPPSGTCRTMDVVGIDTFALVAANVYERAKEDPFRSMFKMPDWIAELIRNKALGQKTGDVGIYRKTTNDKGEREILSYRPASGSYEKARVQSFPWQEKAAKTSKLVERLAFVIEQDDAGAQLVWRVLRDTMVYSAQLAEEIAGGQVKAIDDAIRWGFNWELGPFELWQAFGVERIQERMAKEGMKLPAWAAAKGLKFYDPEPGSPAYDHAGPEKQFDASRKALVPVAKPAHRYPLPKRAMPELHTLVVGNANASLVDLGDGIASLTFHSKMNALDDRILEMTFNAIEKVKKDFDGLMLANEGQAFSAGANLVMILEMIKAGKFADIDQILRRFQGAMLSLKYAPFPTIACPHGLTLGGGCEVSLHCGRRLVAAETYAGLVEAGVGLVPGAGGTKELALRAYQKARGIDRADPMPFLTAGFMLIAMARVSSSGFEAIEMDLFPAATSEVTMSSAHQVARAKETLLWQIGQGYKAPNPTEKVAVVGNPGLQAFRLMLYNMEQGRQVSAHDRLIAEKTATIFCGGEVDAGTLLDEQHFLALERRAFVELCQEPKTVARIEHMLATGKPLRN